ncbi:MULTISPECIES: hypothetical protein [unclassified Streptomyces]
MRLHSEKTARELALKKQRDEADKGRTTTEATVVTTDEKTPEE